MSFASSVPEMTRARMPVFSAIDLQKVRAVFGLARGARGDGDDLVHAVRIGEPLELRHHLQRGVRGFGRERAAVEPAGAEPHHFLLAIDDFEREIGPHPHDDHVQRIGADIDGGYTHRSFIYYNGR